MNTNRGGLFGEPQKPEPRKARKARKGISGLLVSRWKMTERLKEIQ